MYSTVWAPVRRRRTADGLSLPARSISSLSSLFLVLRAILVDVAPARQTFANTLRTGERLRGESDGLDWQTPGQLAQAPSTFTTTPSLQRPPFGWPHAPDTATKRPGPLSQRPRPEPARPATSKTRTEPRRAEQAEHSRTEQNSPSTLTGPAAIASRHP
ncbi:hypothetical protein TASIC1_0011030500 [Trichoderma asperellum]|uniref:Uncharacterized protein n=1 Tax=Trichoderma asperellum TaxID=101201 RepID=A0A6V8R7G1_TRIAP|nr:hypothetical protein TASIC1_0011030500 [Trichoderma asperellum]